MRLFVLFSVLCLSATGCARPPKNTWEMLVDPPCMTAPARLTGCDRNYKCQKVILSYKKGCERLAANPR